MVTKEATHLFWMLIRIFVFLLLVRVVVYSQPAKADQPQCYENTGHRVVIERADET